MRVGQRRRRRRRRQRQLQRRRDCRQRRRRRRRLLLRANLGERSGETGDLGGPARQLRGRALPEGGAGMPALWLAAPATAVPARVVPVLLAQRIGTLDPVPAVPHPVVRPAGQRRGDLGPLLALSLHELENENVLVGAPRVSLALVALGGALNRPPARRRLLLQQLLHHRLP